MSFDTITYIKYSICYCTDQEAQLIAHNAFIYSSGNVFINNTDIFVNVCGQASAGAFKTTCSGGGRRIDTSHASTNLAWLDLTSIWLANNKLADYLFTGSPSYASFPTNNLQLAAKLAAGSVSMDQTT